jgi:hypothetical protein
MDSYRFVLFLHVCALLGAIGTSSLVHFAELRLRTAETVSAGNGWIVAGLVGVAVLFVLGGSVVGGRSRALARELSAAADGPLAERTVSLMRRHPAAVASWMNTGLAIGIVFVMTTKLALAGSLAALATAAGLGALLGLRLRGGAIRNG